MELGLVTIDTYRRNRNEAGSPFRMLHEKGKGETSTHGRRDDDGPHQTQFRKKFGKEKSEYANDFIFNYSLADSDNWRWTMNQWVSTSLTEMLALKVTLTWLYNNVPAFREYTLLEGAPPTDLGNTVLVQLDELDTIFSVSLVLT